MHKLANLRMCFRFQLIDSEGLEGPCDYFEAEGTHDAVYEHNGGPCN